MTVATLSKTERKALRQKLEARKAALLAKHTDPGRAAADRPNFPADRPAAPPTRPPAAQTPGAQTPATVPGRQAASGGAGGPGGAGVQVTSHIPWPAARRKTGLSSAPAPHTGRRRRREVSGRARTGVVRVTQPESGSPAQMAGGVHWDRPAQGWAGVTEGVRPDGPGPLQRGAAAIEHAAARTVALVRQGRQLMKVEPDDRSTFGSVAGVVWPLRLCGVLCAGGAVTMAIQTPQDRLLTLGFGMAIAVGLLSLAEIARAVWGLVRVQPPPGSYPRATEV